MRTAKKIYATLSSTASYRLHGIATGSWKQQQDWDRRWSHDPDRDHSRLHLYACIFALGHGGRRASRRRGGGARGHHADRLARHLLPGVALARDLVLTAAHCVLPGADYKLGGVDPARQPVLKELATIARHPGLDVNAVLRHRVTADVTLVKLGAPLTVRPARLAPEGVLVSALGPFRRGRLWGRHSGRWQERRYRTRR